MMETTLRRIIQDDPHITPEEYAELFLRACCDKKHKALLIALLTALSTKKPNSNDISAFVDFIEKDHPKMRLSLNARIANIVGTGGGISTFNVSTTSAIVAASAGATVVKSGSAAYTSKCGSYDLLNHLGIGLATNKDEIEQHLSEFGIAFTAPTLYPPILKRIAMAILPLTLKDVGLFINVAGPLLCPVLVDHMVCGVSQPELLPLFAQLLKHQQLNSACVVHGDVGMDEFSPTGSNQVLAITQNHHGYHDNRYLFTPSSIGIHHNCTNGLEGGSPETNANKMYAVLSAKADKIAEDIVVLNAAHILMGTIEDTSLEQAVDLSRKVIHSGEALDLLNKLIKHTGITKRLQA